MKATLTSKGQITLPVALRRKLNLKAGDVLEFDESALFRRVSEPVDVERMRSVIGRGKDRLPKRTSAEWIEFLRGPVELP